MIRRPPRSTLFPYTTPSDLIWLDATSTGPYILMGKVLEKKGETALAVRALQRALAMDPKDRKSTRLNSSHGYISYAVFCLKKKNILYNVMSMTPLYAIPHSP